MSTTSRAIPTSPAEFLAWENRQRLRYELVDGTVRLNYSITRQAEVFVGARYTGADFDDEPSILFDTGLHAGLNLRF